MLKKIVKEYPDCFPSNFETDILPSGAKEDTKNVYRIMKTGKIEKDNFLSTYEEILKGSRPKPRNGINYNDPGIYSTSCFQEYDDAEYILNIIMRHNPPACIVLGSTEKNCGPSQLSSDRLSDNNSQHMKQATSHVDWWIYKNATPEYYFEEINDTIDTTNVATTNVADTNNNINTPNIK